MLQLLSSLLDWLASSQGSNLLRACFGLATALGMNGRIVAAAMAVFYLWLAFH